MAAPMEFNIPFCEKELLLKKLLTACKLGYEVIAINNVMPDLLTKQDKAKGPLSILKPDEIKISPDVLKAEIGVRISPCPIVTGGCGFRNAESVVYNAGLWCKTEAGHHQGNKPVQQLSRISAVLWDIENSHNLHKDFVQAYDLIAVQPTSEKTFMNACQSLNVDIITLDVTAPLNFRMKRPTINAAIQRGIHFELQYSPAIRDNTMRRYLISAAESFAFWGKGKNVILTSGCEKPIEMRGPHDVANLANLLFLTETQAKNAITTNCRALLYHSKARRSVQSVLQIEKSELLSASDTWLLDKCHVNGATTSDKDNVDDDNEDDDNSCEPVKKKLKLGKSNNVKKVSIKTKMK